MSFFINSNMLLEDYKYAALNILWLYDNGKRTLIFAFIELFPNEYPKPINIQENSHSVNKTNKRLFFARIIDTVENILNWYSNISSGNVSHMFWQNNEPFELINYEQEPAYPDLLLSNNLPFLQDFVGCVRCHFLFEKDFSEEIRQLCLDEENINWINDNFKFDLSLYSEYIGSICLVAYNPLLRSVNTKLMTNTNTKSESVSFEIEPRYNVDISDLKLLYIEKRNLGYKCFKEVALNNLYFIIDNIGEVEAIGYAVICPKRGLLLWEGFHGFMKSLSLSMNIVTGTNKINVPTKNYDGIEETYETSRYSSETITIGENNKTKTETLAIKLLKSKRTREQKNIAQNTQKLFYENPKEATAFIRSIIAKAQTRITIIDPYITTRELFKFVLSVNPSVKTTIITSSLVLKGGKNKNQAKTLLKNIDNASKNYHIEAMVMLGREPAFHDRFIFIDEEVWISGNSLADIGKRASILIKSSAPKEIQNIYYSIINDKQKITTLKEWIENHETAN